MFRPHFVWICQLLVTSWMLSGCIDEPGPSGGRTYWENGIQYEEYEVERTDYHPAEVEFELPDDVLDPSIVPEFNPDLVHSQLVGGWEVNLSRAVIELDVPEVKPDREEHLLTLHPTYAAAIEAAQYRGYELIPSVNLISGKAKQFDDGLYAALDLAYFEGMQDDLRSHVNFVQALFDAVPSDGQAAPFLAAGLSLAGIEVEVLDVGARDQYLDAFENNRLYSKPIGFYNWTPELQECFRFLKFFQQPMLLTDSVPAMAVEMGAAIAANAELHSDYDSVVTFFSQLTNPPVSLNVVEVVNVDDVAALAASQRAQGLQAAVALFPSSTSTEQRLFDRLFPLGVPPDANLMRELVTRIMSGEVSLEPGADSGWYDYQCFALETLLLPTEGEESVKLVLSGRYKQRMLEAFAAMITKHRETHVRQLAVAGATASAPPPELDSISPMLRLEPNATYYLRTARAYTFLQVFLHATLGEETLSKLHGLTEQGTRELNLNAELQQQRELFYGFYLLSMEDIGLPTSLSVDELPEPAVARQRALSWIADFASDPDLAVDTRVVVPVAVNLMRGTTSLWATTGVRLAKLDAAFASGFSPSIRVPESGADWQEVEPQIVEPITYLIPVDEFMAVEIPSVGCPTREEFRRICDKGVTSDGIAELLMAESE